MDKELTDPIFNGNEVPKHPSTTTARIIQQIVEVVDAVDGTRCTAGLGRNELMVLMRGEPILDHLYRYCVLNNHLYTTRVNGVRFVVKCIDDEPDPTPAQP